MYDFWSSGSGAFNKIIIDDTTGNGQNEVITVLMDPNCHAHIDIMEWQENQFVDLARPSESSLGECRSSWNIHATNEESGKSLVATTSYSFYPTHIFTDTYQWNGAVYEHVDRKNQFPDEIDDRFIFDYERYFQPEERLKLQEALLSSTDNLSYPPHEDVYFEFLKFRKAMLHLFLGETEEGVELLQQITDNPNNLTPPAISQSANVFLETFNLPSDSFQACAAALKSLDDALGLERPEEFEEMGNFYMEKWGFSPYYPNGIICDLQSSLEIVVNYWNSTGVAMETAVPDLLEQSGITPIVIESIDLNGDGILDWLLSIKPSTNHLVALITTDEGLILLPIDSGYRNPSPDQIGLETIMLPGYPNPVQILNASNRPKIFTVETTSGQPQIHEWLGNSTLFYVNQFLISQQNDNVEVIAFVEPYSSIKAYTKAIYRWNPETRDFELVEKRADNSLGIPLDEAITQAETLLFQEGDFEAAIPILTAVLTELNATEELTWAIPRTLYLLGLAYELSDDETNAVDTYWSLWQTFPEAPYALLAQAKLELKP